MKILDKVIYKGDSNGKYTKGASYEILNIDKRDTFTLFSISNDNSNRDTFTVFMEAKNNTSIFKNIYDYFYTPQEVREMKLNQLGI